MALHLNNTRQSVEFLCRGGDDTPNIHAYNSLECPKASCGIQKGLACNRIINPRHTCAARVTVVVLCLSVWVWVWVGVGRCGCGMSDCAIKNKTYSVAYDCRDNCGDFSATFKIYGVKHKLRANMLIRSGLPVIYFFLFDVQQRLLLEGVQACILLQKL